jgi:hypothetical protein
MAQILDDFIAITRELNQREIDYAVCGGWAMAIHGFIRATLDIDLLILIEDLDRAMDAARAVGFDIEGLPLNFGGGKTQIRRISKIDQKSKELITLDLILITEFFQDVWDDRKRVEWNEGEYHVVSVRGLSKMKETAGRPKDLIDLEYLKGLEDG